MSTQNLELYYKPTCPYCVRVLDHLKKLGIEVPLKDISSDEAAAQTLVEVGGKRQVPCLFIDGKPLYESGDIIDWFDKNN